MIDIEAPKQQAAQAERTFTNCALYLKSEFMGNIERIDCRTITITEGVQYAQYTKAVRVRYTPKRKRGERETHLTSRPFLMILSAVDAIDPDAMMTPLTADGEGVYLSKSRYLSFDPRWESDFRAAVQAQGLKPLLEINNEYDTAAR